jgi:hypothetical protein
MWENILQFVFMRNPNINRYTIYLYLSAQINDK